jgi:hypothetical protein
MDTKLARLALIFKKPLLPSQFKSRWFFAHNALVDSNHMDDYWVCWQKGIAVPRARQQCKSHCENQLSNNLRDVVKRGQVFAPVTSKVEQSFAKVNERLGQNRLNASAEVEDRMINLIMTDALNESELDDVLDGAVAIWRECFHRHSRTSVAVRSDKDNVHQHSESSKDAGNTERAFLKRAHESIVQGATASCSTSEILDSAPMPSVWTDLHEKELTFQKEKRRKREVGAHMQGHLFAAECTDELARASIAEGKRQAASYAQRVKARTNYHDKTHAVPPTPLELNGAKCYLEGGMWDRDLRAKVADLNGSITTLPHEATLFIAAEPRNPGDERITLVASLQGFWVISPAVFLGRAGPSIKYCSAFQTGRILYSTPTFRASFANEWRIILEIVKSAGAGCKWRVVRNVQEWANAKAIADAKKKPSTVIALADQSECRPNLKHVFTVEAFLGFVSRTDPTKGSIGLLNM